MLNDLIRSAKTILASGTRPVEVVKRVLVGVFDEGFLHAGNLAYLSLLTLFPFFVLIGSIAGFLGRSGDGLRAVRTFLQTVPPRVADLLAEPIAAILREGGSGLITLSIVVALWTTASYVETIRLILYKAYGFKAIRPIWQRRLLSFAIILGSVLLMLVAFASQFLLVGVEQLVERLIPNLDIGMLQSLRLGPMVALFLALYILFTSLTPREYRAGWPKWPGALATTCVWIGGTNILPWVLANFANTDRFYGPLAGVMVTLIFFFIVGLGFVLGAHLNAALALTATAKLKEDQLKLEGL
ncbi:YihY/virulence factor BrkB family protein [Pacificimonas sp. ICDLI1SI03]